MIWKCFPHHFPFAKQSTGHKYHFPRKGTVMGRIDAFCVVRLNKGWITTVYPKKYAHGFVVLCFVVVMQSFIMNSHEVFIHIHQVCFAGTGAIVRLPQCQWSKPDGYGKISQCITTTKHSKAKTVCIFLGIYCSRVTELCTAVIIYQCQWYCSLSTACRSLFRYEKKTSFRVRMAALDILRSFLFD